jgi:hypothetical protein
MGIGFSFMEFVSDILVKVFWFVGKDGWGEGFFTTVPASMGPGVAGSLLIAVATLLAVGGIDEGIIEVKDTDSRFLHFLIEFPEVHTLFSLLSYINSIYHIVDSFSAFSPGASTDFVVVITFKDEDIGHGKQSLGPADLVDDFAKQFGGRVFLKQFGDFVL